MKSAIRLMLGLSLVAMGTGCDGGTDDPPGPKAVAGSDSTGGSGGSSTGGGGGTGSLAEGIALTPTDGWVDVASNTLGIQGAMFAYADDTSKMGMVESFVGDTGCISGTAAKVDLMCTPMAPATDCYGQFWGAAIGLNLNQPKDPVTMMGVADPLAYDATALKGFAFEIAAGTAATGAVPASLRFKVEDDTGEFCNLGTKRLMVGANQYDFAELTTECWKPTATSRKGDAAKPGVLKIAWQVVTNDKATIPFDYCVKNVRAIME